MQRVMCIAFFSLTLATFFFIHTPRASAGYIDTFRHLMSSIFGISITPSDLRARYSFDVVRVLVVPGHDIDYSGAGYRDLVEADLTLEVATHLMALFQNDPRFNSLTTRDSKTGAYLDAFSLYFAREEDAIKAFAHGARTLTHSLFESNLLQINQPLSHAFAPSEMVTRLYGINKWANENKIDLTIHIHFNDHPGHRVNKPGTYTGFTIYIPERQFPNAVASKDFARPVYEELARVMPVSDLPAESTGLVEDQELIAVGANATREGVGILIEYGYIYESVLADPKVRAAYTKELALATYRGVKRFFEDAGHVPRTAILPYQWEKNLSRGMKNSTDVLSLQRALMEEKLYPPPGNTLRECPLNGNFGPCVASSVKLFQEKYASEIYGTTKPATYSGAVGEATRKVLNERHSAVQ